MQARSPDDQVKLSDVRQTRVHKAAMQLNELRQFSSCMQVHGTKI